MEYKAEWIEEELNYILFRLRKYNRMISISKDDLGPDNLPENKIRTLQRYNIRMRNLIDEIENEFSEGDTVSPEYLKRVGGMLIYPWRASLPILKMEYKFFKDIWNDIQSEMEQFRLNYINYSSTKLRGRKIYGDKQKGNLKQVGIKFDDELNAHLDDYLLRHPEFDKSKLVRQVMRNFLVEHDDVYYMSVYNYSQD